MGTAAAPRRVTWPFAASAPDRIWLGDITHLPTRESALLLAVVIDVHSRRIVGSATDDYQRQELAERALDMVLQQHRPKPGLILHHDHDSQYAAARYRAKAETAKIQLSMSRAGLQYDDTMAESLFASLKLELLEDEK